MTTFPVETKIEQDKNKGTLVLDLQDCTVEICVVAEDRFEEACSFIAFEYLKREPLFLALQRLLKKDVDTKQFISFLKKKYSSHLSSCFVAVGKPKLHPEGRKPSTETLQPCIVGACLCRIIPVDRSDNDLPFQETLSNPVLRYFIENISTTLENETLIEILSKDPCYQLGGYFDHYKGTADVSTELRSVLEIGMVRKIL